MTIDTAVQTTLLDAAVCSGPPLVTDTPSTARLQPPVAATARHTLAGGGVHLATVSPQPTLPADTDTGDAVSMTGAVWVSTVRLVAPLPLVALHADTLPILAVTMARAVRHLALLVPHIALLPLPARLADTLSTDVVSLARAEYRAHTYNDTNISISLTHS